MAHSREEYDAAVEASQILFGKGTTEQLQRMEAEHVGHRIVKARLLPRQQVAAWR